MKFFHHICAAILMLFLPVMNTSAQGSTTTPSQLSPRQSHDNKTLTIAVPRQNLTFNFINSISVFESTLYTALYNGLVTADPQTLQPRVGLAVSWFVNEDNTVYTFNLRKDAKFSDGSVVTAQDVKASWLTSIKADTPFAYLFYSIKGVTDYINNNASLEDIGIEVLSDRTLQITLAQPENYFLKTITHSSFSVTSTFQLAARDWDTNPQEIIYSGPYMVQTSADDEITLVKNPYYWNADNVMMNTIAVKLYDSDNSARMLQDFQNGAIQWMDPNNIANAEQLENIDQSMMYRFPVFGTQYMFFKATEAPWTNPAVRQAIRLLLPLREIRKSYSFPSASLITQIQGVYTPPRNIGAFSHLYFDSTSNSNTDEKNTQKKETAADDADTESSDISAANKPDNNPVSIAYHLLTGAGFPKGQGLPPIILYVPTGDDGSYDKNFDAMKQSLEEHLPVTVSIKKKDSAEYHASLKDENYTMGINSWIGDFADPMAFLQMWTYKNESLGHYYDNDNFRAIVTQASTQSGTIRERSLQAAERKLLNDSMVIPMYHLFSVELVRNDLITGWFATPLNTHNLAAISFKPPQDIPYIIFNPRGDASHTGALPTMAVSADNAHHIQNDILWGKEY